MSTLRKDLASYLQLRHSLGFKLRDAGLQLPRFVAFLEERQADYVTAALSLEWA
jgi:integrase/recombinase XerD